MSEREREEQRESFIESQTGLIDEWFSLTEGEEAERAKFLQLCIDTYDALGGRIQCKGWLFHDHEAKLIFVADK